MREYKIYKTDLWFGIYKKREKDGKISLWFLDWRDKWTLNKSYTKTFYNRESAVSALVIMKQRDGKDAD